MSDNKFIKHLRGEDTTKSVLEVKNQRTTTSFANMPQGTSNANDIYSDHRGNATAVLKGTDNWKLNDNTLTLATTVYGDGRDFTDEYSVGGAGLWVNAVYTFADSKIFMPNTKWVLKLCGSRLFTESHEPIALTLLIKFGTNTLISKTFFVRENSFNFSEELVVDFDESATTPIKVAIGDTMTIQVLCGDATAQAEIYNGMTVLTALQRKVDGEAIASDTRTFGDIEDELENIHEDIDDLKDYTDETFVRLDGQSIMTGPLNMRASISFQCAIAPYWDGIGFFKLNNNDSVTLMASIEYQDSFAPAENNIYNIGSSSKKWKNLYLSGKTFVATINNGGDLAVPANTTGTLATKADVDLAANSGRMITDQGVWYAKMYAGTTPPASAEVEGRNYADFSQTDGQGNPIIVIYTYTSGAWDSGTTVVPPADYDGYVPITSKIWDITEQAGQQGGRVLWNHQSKEFTPYPQIVSFEDIEITGNSTVIMPATPTDDNITNKKYVDDAIAANPQANTDLSNLTSTGKNIGNWSSNVTNCVIEIPQDIKLTLSSGTLTLKAGSKCYLKTDTTTPSITVASDLTTTQTTDGTYFAIYNGSALTTVLTTVYDYNTLPSTYSLPLAIVSVSSGAISSIDQVFNGFGYIGSTVFALPGVKGLMPNGRNADGTARRFVVTTQKVVTTTVAAARTNWSLIINNLGDYLGQNSYFTVDDELHILNPSGVQIYAYVFGTFSSETGGKITSFNTKQPFRAVDYNDVSKVGFTGSYNDLTSRPTDLFDTKWSDHLLSNSSWVRADNFSWNSGTTYSVAYQHLVADIAGKTLQSETVGGVTVQFYLADDGHKICPATEETNVSNIYTATGVAWYYVLDTTNQRFKLPHAKHNKYANNLSVVGNGMTMAFTNGAVERVISASAGSGGYVDAMWGANGVGQSVSTSNLGTLATNGTWGLTPNAQHSGVIAQQEQDTDQYKYLYFYVGTFSNSALENTAGLNASLFNNKADTDLNNVAAGIDFVVESQEPTAGNDYTWYRKYKSGWVEQGGTFATVYNDYHDESVVLPIAMSNSNYTCLISISSGGNARYSAQVDSKTTTGFTVHYLTNITAYAAGWQVSGKAA